MSDFSFDLLLLFRKITPRARLRRKKTHTRIYNQSGRFYMDLQPSSNTDRFIPSLIGMCLFFFALLNRKFLNFQTSQCRSKDNWLRDNALFHSYWITRWKSFTHFVCIDLLSISIELVEEIWLCSQSKIIGRVFFVNQEGNILPEIDHIWIRRKAAGIISWQVSRIKNLHTSIFSSSRNFLDIFLMWSTPVNESNIS